MANSGRIAFRRSCLQRALAEIVNATQAAFVHETLVPTIAFECCHAPEFCVPVRGSRIRSHYSRRKNEIVFCCRAQERRIQERDNTQKQWLEPMFHEQTQPEWR